MPFSADGAGTVSQSESGFPEMTDVETAEDGERAGLAPAGGLPQPERRPLPRRAAGPALPRRRVRADRREGHDRVHDPGGHRPLEAVAARLLPVLRRQGRAAARAVRGDDSRGDRRPPQRRRVDVRSARAAARVHDPAARVVRPVGEAAQARHAQPPADHGVLGAAHGRPPRPGEGRDGADLADDGRARRRRGRRRRDRRGRHRGAPPRSCSRR